MATIDVTLDKAQYKPRSYCNITVDDKVDDNKLINCYDNRGCFDPKLFINGDIVPITAISDYQLKFKVPQIDDGVYSGNIITEFSNIAPFSININDQVEDSQIGTYSALTFPIWSLYPRSFFNCLCGTNLMTNPDFPIVANELYHTLVDKSPSKTSERADLNVEDVLQKISSNVAYKEKLIPSYDEFWTSLANKYIKDDILTKFDYMVRNTVDNFIEVNKITDTGNFESFIDSDYNFINMFSDQISGNLKELVASGEKLYFEVNNVNGNESSDFIRKQSINYEGIPTRFFTDFSGRAYSSGDYPDEYTYVSFYNDLNAKDRGVRVVGITDSKSMGSPHFGGIAVDTNIQTYGSRILKGSQFSRSVKKLIVMDYLYSVAQNSLVPCRIEINDDSVPHIHLDSKQDGIPHTGINLFRGSYLYFMEETNQATLNGYLRTIAENIAKNVANFSSVNNYIFDYVGVSNPNESFYGLQRVETGSGWKLAKDVVVGDVVVDGNKTIESISSEVNDRNSYYDENKAEFDEFEQLKGYGYSRLSKGEAGLLRSVEYCSYVITACVKEYLSETAPDIASAFTRATGKVTVDGNFIKIVK